MRASGLQSTPNRAYIKACKKNVIQQKSGHSALRATLMMRAFGLQSPTNRAYIKACKKNVIQQKARLNTNSWQGIFVFHDQHMRMPIYQYRMKNQSLELYYIQLIALIYFLPYKFICVIHVCA